ncbi:hypothetical protein KSD_36170 [Ktedonobacter sp. SOSP1-85]|uniref:hypothetical protein n=1 Tax=Ktedonobacter sp. SOSP1-85 TaxID=2778367 RepID=UPI001914E0CE|nr:hypothetical protein [Ktedonobacter sp. SOSP1-85]GHO75846.1 hypothetical protein KSD_36170 [Ktedonobacter sp. SOSP1-85]
MEEGSSDTTSNSRRLEGLLDQLGTRYNQSFPGPIDGEDVAPPASTNEPPPLPGSWLSNLKRLEQDPVQADANAEPIVTHSQPLGIPGDKGFHPDMVAPQPLTYPQIPGAWASSHVSQSGIQSAPVAKARTTNKLDEKLLLLQASASASTIPNAVTPSQTTLGIVHIPPGPPRKSSGSSKRRYSVQIIICLALLGVAGISWLLQQVNLMPSLPTQETQQHITSVATPIGTSGIQITPIQTSTATHSPTKTPTKVKPTQPAVVPTTPPTQVAKPPVTSTGIISFEDGGLDGWVHSDPDGTVSALKNLSTSSAKDGSHVLMVSYDSDNNQSYPTFETGQLPKTLNAGQTVRTYILKTQGSNVEASLYIADQNDTWYKSTADSDTALVNNAQTWYSVSFTVPSNIQGPATKVGIILFGYNAVVYIDAYSW